MSRIARIALVLLGLLLAAGCASKPKVKVTLPDKRPPFGKAAQPHPSTLLATARVLKLQGRLAESETLLRRAIKEEPKYLPAYDELAMLLTSQDRLEDARRTLDQALEIEPGDPFLLNNAGMCCLLAHDYAGAAGFFEKAHNAEPKENRYTANLAVAKAMQGQIQEARTLYETFLPPEVAESNLKILQETRRAETPPASGQTEQNKSPGETDP